MDFCDPDHLANNCANQCYALLNVYPTDGSAWIRGHNRSSLSQNQTSEKCGSIGGISGSRSCINRGGDGDCGSEEILYAEVIIILNRSRNSS